MYSFKKASFALFFLIYPFLNLFPQQWQSAKVKIESGKLAYPSDHEMNRIPDFSFAGYKSGLEPLPEIKVKETVSPVKGDNTAHIQDAINKVSNLPLDSSGFRGAVLLSPGLYEVRGTIKLNASGVVLRGAGDGKNPKKNSIIFGKGDQPHQRDIIVAGGGNNTEWKGQVPDTKTNITSNFVQVGSFSFQVKDVAPFKVGDNIIIHHPGTKEWMQAIGQQHWPVNKYNIVYNRNITHIKGNTITIDAPVYNHLDRSLSQSYIYKYDRKGILNTIGIENLRIDIEYSGKTENHARNAIVLKQIENSWIKNCSVLHFIHSGFKTTTATFITVENCKALAPKGIVTGGRFYNFNTALASNNILFKSCLATESRHAFVSNGVAEASGIVVYNCTSKDPFTSAEGHRHWTTGMLYDNFRIYGSFPNNDRVFGLYNRGDYGTYHGWASANSVIWNADFRRKKGEIGKGVIQQPRTAQNYAIGGYGNFTGDGPFPGKEGYIEGIGKPGLQPSSLYQAQLAQRKKGINPKNPVPAFLESPTKDINDYPLLFKNKLYLTAEKKLLGAYTVYNKKNAKLEESPDGPSKGIGEKLQPGIYSLKIEVGGRTIVRKIIKSGE